VFLVLSHTWLERKGDQLFLHKGVWLEPGTQQVYIDRYDPPRRVTYFANYFTNLATFGKRTEGESLERGLICALSLSCEMEPYINDKLFVRAILERGLVSFPRTLGILWKSSRKYSISNSKRLSILNVSVVKRNTLRAAVRSFITTAESPTIVVKRGGPERLAVREVLYFDVSTEFDQLMDCVCDTLPKLHDGSSLILEEFLQTMPSQRLVTERMVSMIRTAGAAQGNPESLFSLQEAFDTSFDTSVDTSVDAHSAGVDVHAPVVTSSSSSSMSFVVRALSVVDGANQPVVSSIVAAVGAAAYPIEMRKSLPMTLFQVLRQWGVHNKEEQARILETVTHEAKRIHQLVLNAETELAETINVSRANARSDVISIDFILALTGSLIAPQAIRVHDHDSLDLFHRLENITKSRGECVRPWVNTMISRSQSQALRGKTLCIVGGGGYSSLAKVKALFLSHNSYVFGNSSLLLSSCSV
jgi:hypothetical protein